MKPGIHARSSARSRRGLTLGLLTLVAGLAAPPSAPVVRAQGGTISLGLTVNSAAIAFGEPLRVGITADNPGGGQAADIVFALLLPDGSTLVSAGPGIGVRFGRLGDLRSVVPVLRGVPLAAPFRFQEPSFFNYTFTGVEPQGTYRIVFAAFTAGALDDGTIGAGELLALATRDVVVSAAPPLTTVDPARRVTVVVPRAGGVVQTTNAAGATLTLTVPANAVPADTTMSITPLTAFQNLPLGPLVAGVALEPSGLTFATPATLTMTLPPGYVVPPMGVAGFLANSAGRSLQAVPATVAGRVVTVSVPHFSTAGIALDTFYFDLACDPSLRATAQKATACANLRPLVAAEAARLAVEGGFYDNTFLAHLRSELSTWMSQGLRSRLEAGATPDLADPLRFIRDVGFEWTDWAYVFDLGYGLTNRSNEARLGSSGSVGDLARQADLGQNLLRDVALAAMNANNSKCLADKAGVDLYVGNLDFIRYVWAGQFQGDAPTVPLPFEEHYCVDVAIDAVPPSTLTPGTPVEMPIAIRVRFIDGVELPGPPLIVAITATDAGVSPAGGVLAAPIVRPVTLTPTASNSTVTITAGFGASPTLPALASLPARSATFQAGRTVPITLKFGELEADMRLTVDGRDVNIGAAGDSEFTLPDAEIAVLVPETFRGDYTSDALMGATRRIRVEATGLTATLAGSVSLGLRSHNPVAAPIVFQSDVADHWCLVTSTPLAVHAVHLDSTTRLSVGGVGRMESGARAVMPAGENCVDYSSIVRRTLQSGTLGGVASAQLGYTLTFSPVP